MGWKPPKMGICRTSGTTQIRWDVSHLLSLCIKRHTCSCTRCRSAVGMCSVNIYGTNPCRIRGAGMPPFCITIKVRHERDAEIPIETGAFLAF